jgi:hypothetical protein
MTGPESVRPASPMARQWRDPTAMVQGGLATRGSRHNESNDGVVGSDDGAQRWEGQDRQQEVGADADR